MEAAIHLAHDEKRSVPRRHLIYYLRVFEGFEGKLLGNLVDISTKGIMLVSEMPIAVDQTFRLKMMLPQSLEGSREVEFSAESRWCKSDINNDFYDTGFELIDPKASFLEAVDRLVEECLFKE